jgi:hypothetical protein
VMRALALLAIVVGSIASIATSAPEDSLRPDAAPEPRRNWVISSERIELAPPLRPGQRAGYRVRGELSGDLRMLAEEHRASLSISLGAEAQSSEPPVVSLEVSDGDGVVAAETTRRAEPSIWLPVSLSTDHCPRQQAASCTYELEVWVGVDDAPADVAMSLTLSASGLLERPTVVLASADLEVDELDE